MCCVFFFNDKVGLSGGCDGCQTSALCLSDATSAAVDQRNSYMCIIHLMTQNK